MGASTRRPRAEFLRNPEMIWRASTWRTGPETSELLAVDELLGPELPRWREVRAANPVVAARMLAGRRAVAAIVRDHDLFPWRGFAPGASGRKPAFADGRGDFSVAHSGELLLVAVVARGRVGVDVELNRDAFDAPGLDARLCSPAELALAAGLDPVTRRAWLTRLWTAKEAIAKLEGLGLARDFRALELADRIPVDRHGSIAASIAVASDRDPHDIRLQHPELGRAPLAESA